MNEPTPRMAKPPKAPSAQVATTNVANALLGIYLASPQNVMGPPAAAVKRSAAAGAVPMPSSNRSATSGISNNSGTLIRTPNVAAIATPVR